MSGIVTRQALLYIAAFLITWIFGVLGVLNNQTDAMELTDQGVKNMSILRMIFQHLQGLFNLMIFVYHKVHTLRTADESLSVSEAIAKVFFFAGQMEDKAVISNLNMVVDDYIAGLYFGKRNTKMETKRNLQ